MNRAVIFLIALLGFAPVCAQQLTLHRCYDLAHDNYPMIKRYDLILSSAHYSLAEASKGWIPQASLSGKASYQSDVVGLPISLPGIDIQGMSKDQYQATVDVSQTIWDGGTIRASKAGIRAAEEVSRLSLEVDMYNLRERVNNLYFGILLSNEQLRLNASYISLLGENMRKVEALSVNGVSSQADVDAVRVELVKARQDSINLVYTAAAYTQMLSRMIGQTVDRTQLVVPDEVVYADLENAEVARPELQVFEAQRAMYEVQKMGVNAQTMPRFSAYAQAGVGSPGLNMLKSGFGTWLLGGVRLNWNFGAFYTMKDKKNNLNINKQETDVTQQTFLYNLELQAAQQRENINQYRAAMLSDDQIISLKQSIERSSEAKMRNGTMGVTDYMRDVIATQSSRQSKVLRQMQLLMEVYTLKNTLNN